MRCGCFQCGAYMAQSEGPKLGCVCPECGFRCRACLGTDTVIPREKLRAWADAPAFQSDLAADLRAEDAEIALPAAEDGARGDWEDEKP